MNTTLKTLFFLSIASVAFFFYTSKASAVVCQAKNACVEGKYCIQTKVDANRNPVYENFGGPCGGSQVVGKITAPQGIVRINSLVGGNATDIGIIIFASRLLRLATIVAGIWVMFNFIFAGFIYVSSNGDAATHGKVSEKLTYSVIGILIIVIAYTLAAVLSLLFFGDANFILSPELVTIQDIGP
jgi:hypothetical protein